MLESEVISAQSARVDIISGATLTSDAYLRSLNAALEQGGFLTMMRDTRLLMGMPITVEIVDDAPRRPPGRGLRLFRRRRRALQHLQAGQRDQRAQPGPRRARRLSAPRCGRCWRSPSGPSARPTAISTSGGPTGALDPSGIVKGWAIRNAADLIRRAGARDFYRRRRRRHPDRRQERRTARPGRVGIRNPFNEREIIKVGDAARARRSRPRAPMCAASTSTIRTLPGGRSTTSSA